MTLNLAETDFILWIPVGGALGYFFCGAPLTRRIARLLDNTLASKPTPDEWPTIKAHLSNYRLGLYVIAIVAGAIIGAGIGSLAFVFQL